MNNDNNFFTENRLNTSNNYNQVEPLPRNSKVFVTNSNGPQMGRPSNVIYAEAPKRGLSPVRLSNVQQQVPQRTSFIAAPAQNYIQAVPTQVQVIKEQPAPQVQFVKEIEQPIYIEKYIDREVPVYNDRIIEQEVERPVYYERIVEKEVEKPVYYEKIVEKEVEKPVYYEKIVQKEVEQIVYVDQIIEQEIEVPVYIDKIVEKIVEVEKPVYYEKTVEVEQPVYYERTVQVEKPVYYEQIVEKEVPVERIVEKEIIVEKEVFIEKPIYIKSEPEKIYMEKEIYIDKPVYIEKEVIIENRQEVQSYRQRIHQLEEELSRSRREKPQVMETISYVEDTEKLNTLENKVRTLLDEIERLNRVLLDRSNEIDNLKLNSNGNAGDEIDRLRQLVNIKNDEIDRLKQNQSQPIRYMTVQEPKIVTRQSPQTYYVRESPNTSYVTSSPYRSSEYVVREASPSNYLNNSTNSNYVIRENSPSNRVVYRDGNNLTRAYPGTSFHSPKGRRIIESSDNGYRKVTN